MTSSSSGWRQDGEDRVPSGSRSAFQMAEASWMGRVTDASRMIVCCLPGCALRRAARKLSWTSDVLARGADHPGSRAKRLLTASQPIVGVKTAFSPLRALKQPTATWRLILPKGKKLWRRGRSPRDSWRSFIRKTNWCGFPPASDYSESTYMKTILQARSPPRLAITSRGCPYSHAIPQILIKAREVR